MKLISEELFFNAKTKSINVKNAYLCITPPALKEAEYLQSVLGTLGCKRK